MSVSCSTSPPYCSTSAHVAGMSSTLSEMWVSPSSFIVRGRYGAGVAPSPAKCSSSSTNDPCFR